MRRLFTLVFAAVAMCATAAAQQPFKAVVTTEGTLAEVIGDQIEQIESLSVEGSINAEDFRTMDRACRVGRLGSIDLSKAVIADNAIPDKAFRTLYTPDSKLSTIKLPQGLKSIGNAAFLGTPLTSIELPASLESIGSSAFYNCRQLSGEVEIPAMVTTISAKAFAYCRSLDKVVCHEGLTAIGSMAFFSSSLKEIDLPESVKRIEINAFGRTRLKEATIPAACEYIGEDAFAECAELESLTLNSTCDIPYGFAIYCSKLSNLHLADGIKVINGEAFGNTALKSITIPASVTNILSGAFFDVQLESIYSLSGSPIASECDDLAFDSPDTPVYVPQGSKGAYESTTGWWSYFTNIIEVDMAGTDDAIASQGVSVRAERGRIAITADDAPYTVYTTDGRTVAAGRASGTVTVDAAPGLYIVRAGTTTAKVRL